MTPASVLPAGLIWTSHGTAEVVSGSDFKPIKTAVYAQDRLWLLHDDGFLASLAEGEPKVRREMLPTKAIEICKLDDHLFTIVPIATDWVVQQRVGGDWITKGKLAMQGDSFVGAACGGDPGILTVLTSRRVIRLAQGSIRSVKLLRNIAPSVGVATLFATPNAVWIGYNRGEWGGGLRRIDLKSGNSAEVTKNSSGRLCGGPLNTDCDPVTGIAPAPWDRSCVVASIGLVHLNSLGRIVEVCGKSIRRRYFKPVAPASARKSGSQDEPVNTVAFFGLQSATGGLWAIGMDGVYRFDGAGGPEFRPLPNFVNRGGYQVSFDLPHIVLVMTDVNQRRSLSGSVPLIVAR